MPEFDALAEQTFAHVSNLMGEPAVWLASNRVSGRVLYKDPTEPVQIGDAERYEYRPNDITIEYYLDTFVGLKKAVDSGERQFIEVRGRRFFVVDITTKFDGGTYVAQLAPDIEEIEPEL